MLSGNVWLWRNSAVASRSVLGSEPDLQPITAFRRFETYRRREGEVASLHRRRLLSFSRNGRCNVVSGLSRLRSNAYS
jgi:hypothetical protein